MTDVQRWRVLRAVVATGSVNGAASAMGHSPSAISQHLTALQRETGIPLVQRSGRGIEPTAAGLRLAAESDKVFQSLAGLDALVADLRGGRTGRLVVGYFASAGSAWIPPVVAVLAREFPGLRLDLRLVELDDGTAEPDVEVFVEGAPSSPLTGYEVMHLVEDPYFAVVARDHRLAGLGSVPLRELRDETWVDNDVARGRCRQNVLDACAAVGFAPVFRVETQDYPTAVRVVAEGFGLTVIPRLGLRDLPAAVVAVPIVDPPLVRRIGLRVRRTSAAYPAVRRLAELLVQASGAGRAPSAAATAAPERTNSTAASMSGAR